VKGNYFTRIKIFFRNFIESFLPEVDGLEVEALERLHVKNPLSNFILPQSFDPDLGFFFCADNTVGLMYELPPLTAAGEKTVQALRDGIYKADLPEDTLIQFILWGSEYIEPFLQSYVSMRPEEKRWFVERYADFYRKHIWNGPFPEWLCPLRNFRLFFVLKLPYSLNQYQKKKEELYHLRERIFSTLKAAGFTPYRVKPRQLIQIYYLIFNPNHDKNRSESLHYDPAQEIRKQCIMGDTVIEQDDDYIRVDGVYGKALTVQAYPKEIDIGRARNLVGNIMGNDAEQINTPFFLTLCARRATETEKRKIYAKEAATPKAKKISSFSKKHEERVDELLYATNRLTQDGVFWKCSLIWYLYHPDYQFLTRAVNTLTHFAQGSHFTLQEEIANLPLFLACTPFNLTHPLLDGDVRATPGKKLARKKRTLSFGRAASYLVHNCTHLSPVQGDWSGTPTPTLPFVGRMGQVASISLWDTNASKNTVIVAPTGAGKCRAEGYLQTEVGFCDIKEVKKGDRVLAYSNGSLEAKKVVATYKFENEKVVEIKTKFGRKLRCTPDHKFLVEDPSNRRAGRHWKQAQDLRKGDILPVSLGSMRFGTWGNSNMGYLLGVLYADGTWRSALKNKNANVSITNSSKEVRNRVKKAVLELGYKAYENQNVIRIERNFIDYMLSLGIKPALSHKKKLPPFITKNASKDFWIGFIEGSLDTNTYINKKNIEISLSSSQLIDQIRTILEQGFGIVCNKRYKHTAFNGKRCHDAHILTIGGSSARKFVSIFKSLKPKKQDRLKKFLETPVNDNNDLLPESHTKALTDLLIEIAKEETSEVKTKPEGLRMFQGKRQAIFFRERKWRFDAYKNGTKRLSRRLALDLIASMKNMVSEDKFINTLTYWQNLLSNWYFDEVVEITDGGTATVYDVTVEDKHNYLSDGMVNHNSFLANHIATHYWSLNSLVRIVDVGYSYEPICRLFNGQFVEIDPANPITMNPFSEVKDLDADMSFLVSIVSKMMKPKDPVSDRERGIIERAIRMTFEKYGKETNITKIRDTLLEMHESEHDKLLRQIAVDHLAPWVEGGQYGRLVNGKNQVDFHNPFVVVELSKCETHETLKSVVLLMVFYHLSREIYHGSEHFKKIIIWDEAWRYLHDEVAVEQIEKAGREYRKFNAALIIITQSISDLARNESTKVIEENSDFLFILPQKSGVVKEMEKTQKFGLYPFEYKLINTLTTQKERYSEFFAITCKNGNWVLRFLVPEDIYWIYTTDPDDKVLRSIFMEAGWPIEKIMDKCVQIKKTPGLRDFWQEVATAKKTEGKEVDLNQLLKYEEEILRKKSHG